MAPSKGSDVINIHRSHTHTHSFTLTRLLISPSHTDSYTHTHLILYMHSHENIHTCIPTYHSSHSSHSPHLTQLISLTSSRSTHLFFIFRCPSLLFSFPFSVLNLCLIKLLTCGVLRSYNFYSLLHHTLLRCCQAAHGQCLPSSHHWIHWGSLAHAIQAPALALALAPALALALPAPALDPVLLLVVPGQVVPSPDPRHSHPWDLPGMGWTVPVPPSGSWSPRGVFFAHPIRAKNAQFLMCLRCSNRQRDLLMRGDMFKTFTPGKN